MAHCCYGSGDSHRDGGLDFGRVSSSPRRRAHGCHGSGDSHRHGALDMAERACHLGGMNIVVMEHVKQRGRYRGTGLVVPWTAVAETQPMLLAEV